jgi:hypothetical protein
VVLSIVLFPGIVKRKKRTPKHHHSAPPFGKGRLGGITFNVHQSSLKTTTRWEKNLAQPTNPNTGNHFQAYIAEDARPYWGLT